MSSRLVQALLLIFAAFLIAYGVLAIVLAAGPDQVIGAKPLDEVSVVPPEAAFVRLEFDPVLHPDNALQELSTASGFESRLQDELSGHFGAHERSETRNRVGFLIRAAIHSEGLTYLFGTMAFRLHEDSSSFSGSGFSTVRITIDPEAPRNQQLRAIEIHAVGDPGARSINGPEYAPWMDEGGESLEVSYKRLAAN